MLYGGQLETRSPAKVHNSVLQALVVYLATGTVCFFVGWYAFVFALVIPGLLGAWFAFRFEYVVRGAEIMAGLYPSVIPSSALGMLSSTTIVLSICLSIEVIYVNEHPKASLGWYWFYLITSLMAGMSVAATLFATWLFYKPEIPMSLDAAQPLASSSHPTPPRSTQDLAPVSVAAHDSML